MNNISPTAMVLAAGLGTRMRPLTLTKPKPLFKVGQRTMLDHAIDKLRDAGLRRVVVNCYYLADQIVTHLRERRDIEIIISRETELLDTGGGIKNALHHFDDQPFFALNADLPWFDGPTPSLARMISDWNPEKMDVLMLLMPSEKAKGFRPPGNSEKGYAIRGDFMMDADGRTHRHDSQPPYPYVSISAQILKPHLIAETPERVFSNNVIWDRAETLGRLYGLLHHGTCYHVGTPEDLKIANTLLELGEGWL